MRKLNRRETILLSGLALAVIGGLWYVSRDTENRVPGTGPAGAAARGGAGAEAPVVRINLLEREVEPYNPNGRDLFKYAERPPSSEEIRAAKAAAEAQKKADEMAAKLAKEQAEHDALIAEQRRKYLDEHPAPPPQPTPPQITFRYIGLLGPKDHHIAVFEEGKEIFVASKGQVIRGQFRLIDFKYETVVMGYTRPEFKNERQELRMVTK